MSFLLDTCVLSEMVKPIPDQKVVAWLDAADESSLYLSVLTLGELEKGIAKNINVARKTRLIAWVHSDLSKRFEGRIVAIDAPVAQRWGALVGSAENNGMSLPVIDSLLAATCIEYKLIVVTRNVKDFECCGVVCLNPWK